MEILIAIRDFNILRFGLFTIGDYFSLSFFEKESGYSLFSVSILLSKDVLGFYFGFFYKEGYKEFARKNKGVVQ